ncbi:MAG TPA: hypothetical protein PLN07_06380, partial [Myxococcota bacterium]|nr:hypothetical protein [Myxococcota bacterium]
MFKRALPLVTVLFVACGGGTGQFENYCVGFDCGAHGHCAVGAEGPLCICDQGYTLQDGLCKESPTDDPCEGITCDNHGVCAVTQGKTAVCLCRIGYHADGTNCVEDDVPRSPCAGVTCGGHGSCLVNADNEAVCICDEGYHQEGGDNCVATAGPCAGVTCGGHGSCLVNADNQAVCIC